jgi:hypothetical protein
MSDAVVVGLFSLIGVMYAATLPLLISTRRHVKSTATQTSNGHKTNMRDDIDVLIVATHKMHDALGIEDSVVRQRYLHIKERQKERPS